MKVGISRPGGFGGLEENIIFILTVKKTVLKLLLRVLGPYLFPFISLFTLKKN